MVSIETPVFSFFRGVLKLFHADCFTVSSQVQALTSLGSIRRNLLDLQSILVVPHSMTDAEDFFSFSGLSSQRSLVVFAFCAFIGIAAIQLFWASGLNSRGVASRRDESSFIHRNHFFSDNLILAPGISDSDALLARFSPRFYSFFDRLASFCN